MRLMRYPKEQKEQTRRKILEAAGRLFRERGYDGVGVDKIMAEVGLTAGGFYCHFPSKGALFAEALGDAFDTRHQSMRAKKSGGDEEALKDLIFSYLSRTHARMTVEGCIFPSLTADVVRGSDETRASYEARLRKFLATIEEGLPEGDTAVRERAIGVLVQMIGGVMLARAVNDQSLAGDILKACRQAALKLGEG